MDEVVSWFATHIMRWDNPPAGWDPLQHDMDAFSMLFAFEQAYDGFFWELERWPATKTYLCRLGILGSNMRLSGEGVTLRNAICNAFLALTSFCEEGYGTFIPGRK